MYSSTPSATKYLMDIPRFTALRTEVLLTLFSCMRDASQPFTFFDTGIGSLALPRIFFLFLALPRIFAAPHRCPASFEKPHRHSVAARLLQTSRPLLPCARAHS